MPIWTGGIAFASSVARVGPSCNVPTVADLCGGAFDVTATPRFVAGGRGGDVLRLGSVGGSPVEVLAM